MTHEQGEFNATSGGLTTADGSHVQGSEGLTDLDPDAGVGVVKNPDGTYSLEWYTNKSGEKIICIGN